MSHLLLSNDGHVGPDEFIQLVYRNTATNATDIDDTMVTARRRRRVSSYLLNIVDKLLACDDHVDDI